jgi:hypothetical protein
MIHSTLISANKSLIHFELYRYFNRIMACVETILTLQRTQHLHIETLVIVVRF